MKVSIKSNADAFIASLARDLSKLEGNGMRGSIENNKFYANFVNFGTSKMAGRHFVENSIPGTSQIMREEFGKISCIPTTAEMKAALDMTLRRGWNEEFFPRTPRSNIDHTHMQDVWSINIAEVF